MHEEIVRDRENELKETFLSQLELKAIIQNRFQLAIDTIKSITDERLNEKQLVRSRERTNLDMLHQCAAHYSELSRLPAAVLDPRRNGNGCCCLWTCIGAACRRAEKRSEYPSSGKLYDCRE
ncbi:DUF1572 family protein [Paenibacillus sp. LPE1-1-1.1]